MADEKGGLAVGAFPDSSSPVVHLAPIKDIQTYQVQEMELDRFDELASAENRSLGFTMFTAGVFLTTLLSGFAASALSSVALAVHIGVGSSAGLLTIFFGLTWNKARKERPRLVEAIKNRNKPLSCVK
jgi:hypothetical protein